MPNQSAVLTSPGQLESLRFVNSATRAIQPHEVEIAVEAAALNFKDVLLGLGLMPPAEGVAPGFGFECAGTVTKVGADVTEFAAGDAVVAIGEGCLASTVCVPASSVARRPRSLSGLRAVTMPIAFLTAAYALEELAHLRATDRVLIHAATGGVGLAAVQIARRIGATIFATAGNEEKRCHLRDLGIRHVMNSRTPDFAGETLAATNGAGVDVVVNSLSGELMLRSLEVLAAHGRFVELGARDAIAGQTLALSLFRRGASYCAVGYQAPIPRLGARLREVMARAGSHEYAPLPIRVFGKEEAGEALAYLASAKHIGKVVVSVAAADASAAYRADLLSPVEGARLFELCLASGRASMAISKTNLTARIAVRIAAKTQRSAPSTPPAARHPRPLLSVPMVAARNTTESKIAEVWARHFEIDEVGVNDDFFDLGGDSLLAVQVSHSLRAALGRDLPTHLILENPTVAELAAQLEPAAPRRSVSRHLVQLAKGPGDARPIFLVHPIGGHVYFYLPMAAQLSAFAPVYGLQAQGVDGEAPPLSTIEEMAAGYLDAMRSVQPHGPYRLAGSSFGGVVCFEMAHQLEAAGEPVELLALVDSPTPASLKSFFRSDAEILAYLLAKGESPESRLRELSGLTGDQMLHYFLRQGGAGDRLAPGATVESVRHFLRLFRANYEALVKYNPRRLENSGLFFQAANHNTFNTQSFEQDWRPYFAELELIGVPGNHTSMNFPPNCDGMVRRIQHALHTKTGATR